MRELPGGTSGPLLGCDCGGQDEVSSVDKVRPLMDGQSRELDVRMDGGGRVGELNTQTNKMKDREALPAKAFRQHKSQSNLLTANCAAEGVACVGGGGGGVVGPKGCGRAVNWDGLIAYHCF